MTPYLIRNGTIVAAETNCRADVAVDNGLITAVGQLDPALYPGHTTIDAVGKFVLPGGFDPHVHFALPTPAGNSCDDFRSGSIAALSGGTTFFMDFVTPRRGQSLAEALYPRRVEAASSLAGYGLHVGISEWNREVASEVVTCMEREGIRSFKAYLAYRESIGINPEELCQMMQVVGLRGGVVMVHCEDGAMIASLQQEFLRDGMTGARFHALSHPPEAEIRAIGKVIELSAKTGCQAYIVHTSTRQGADAISKAKQEGIQVSGETCPQYLLLDDSLHGMPDDLHVLPYVISPPLRGKDDQQRLWAGLSDGTFDVVATDHCPFNLVGQKDRGLHDFTRIPNGAGGVEHRLGLLYTYGVLTNKISMSRLVSLVSTRPAEIFGYGDRKGKLLPGYDADLVIWDPGIKRVISAKTHLSHCDSEIYEGFPVQGGAEMVMKGGALVITKNLKS
ncbi:MAG: dihydropyrimidinase [Bacteroidota bacterium]